MIIKLLLASTLFIAVFSAAQEPYEDRAARLQPQDIPPLIEKGEAGDLPSQVLLWLAYSADTGFRRTIGKPFHGCAKQLNRVALKVNLY
jgi:hypothetical protein